MKHAIFVFIFSTVVAKCGQDLANFTNDVKFGSADFMSFGIASDEAWVRSRSFEEALALTNYKVWAERTNELILHYNTTNHHHVLVPKSVPWSLSSYLSLTLKTANGAVIPPTDQGKPYSNTKQAVELTEETDGARGMPPLTDLFQFPSNGEYVLEAQVWWWDQQNKLTASQPIRLQVVRTNAALPKP